MATLSRAQATTIYTIATRGGEMNGWAGQPGFYCNSVKPLIREGLVERVESCGSCQEHGWGAHQCDRPLEGQRSGDCCYDRIRLTEAGWQAARNLDRAA